MAHKKGSSGSPVSESTVKTASAWLTQITTIAILMLAAFVIHDRWPSLEKKWAPGQPAAHQVPPAAAYIPSYTLGCGGSDTTLPERAPSVKLKVPPTGECWTAWQIRPENSPHFRTAWPNLPGQAHLEAEGKCRGNEIVERITMADDNDETNLDARCGNPERIRFRNTGTVDLTAEIQLR